MTRLRTYSTIDEETGRHVRELHKRHPKLGHHGLLNILHQEGYDIDAEELEEFMRNHKMQPGLVRRTWGWVARRWVNPPWTHKPYEPGPWDPEP